MQEEGEEARRPGVPRRHAEGGERGGPERAGGEGRFPGGHRIHRVRPRYARRVRVPLAAHR